MILKSGQKIDFIDSNRGRFSVEVNKTGIWFKSDKEIGWEFLVLHDDLPGFLDDIQDLSDSVCEKKKGDE